MGDLYTNLQSEKRSRSIWSKLFIAAVQLVRNNEKCKVNFTG